MSQLRIERLSALPDVASRTASTLYLVQDTGDSNHLELYVTGTNTAETRRVVTRTDVNNKIATAISEFNSVKVVSDIVARDALTLTSSTMVLVLDASADATVTTGAAMYVWDNDGLAWYKVAEYESMDFTINWATLQDKPTSTVVDIDDAVARRHTHANAVQLDKIGEDVNGKFTYNGAGIETTIAVAQW